MLSLRMLAAALCCCLTAAPALAQPASPVAAGLPATVAKPAAGPAANPAANPAVNLAARPVADATVSAIANLAADPVANPATSPVPHPGPDQPRPRVALVLSGGGARGFAHIGVLRVLRELRVPIDIVVGTSMGSVVGGAYAAGSSVAQLELLARRTDWNSVVADRPPRDELNYRRREEDLLLPSRIEFGAYLDGVSLPPAAAGNESLELALTRVLPPGTSDKPVNQLPLPFRSVASDLVTGELVELDDTPLFLAIRASLAVPGVFAPVRVKQRLVVDGGLVRNLPVDVARAMGADVVIAVNVGTPLAPEKELSSAIRVAQQMLQILTEQNVQRSLKELGPRDILLAPDLHGVGFLDFARHDRAIQAGERAARAMSAQLLQLAIPEAQYMALEQRRLAGPAVADAPLPLRQLTVEPSGQINPRVLEVQSGLKLGQQVTVEQAQQAGAQLFGRGDLARVETTVIDEDGGRSVTIKPTEADWARSRLRVGLELASDFSDNNSFALKMMHVRSSLNDWGAELRSSARIGNERAFAVQFWQPLGPGAQWYVAPSIDYGAGAADLFNLTGQRQYRIGYNAAGAMVMLGRQLGSWGDVRLGVRRQSANYHVTIPQDDTALRLHQTVQLLAFNADTLDSVAFPTRGGLLSVELQRMVSNEGERISLLHQGVQAMQAFHTTNWAGHLYGEWARSQDGLTPPALGGFLRLSGTAPESVKGNHVVLGRMVMARTVGAMPAALGGDVRLGFSLEAGSAYGPGHELQWSSLKQAVSGFVAVDTRFGPLYFGAGATRGSSGTLYLFLGPVW